jgi:putative glycosyltransferase
MKLSIVSSMYNAESYISEFVTRVRAAAIDVSADYEIILVNDGSTDHSLPIARELGRLKNDLVVVDLTRNFGQHRALLEGMKLSDGERVFLIDSDLEEDPAWLTKFDSLMNETGADMVSGVQAARRGRGVDRVVGEAFYSSLNRLTKFKIPKNPVTARLLTRQFCDAVARFGEQAIFLPGIFSYAGFEHVTTSVSKTRIRPSGYSTRQKITLAINAITSFSSAPLRYIFYLGFLLFGASLLASCVFVLAWYFFSEAPTGWTSLIISVWALGGLIMMALGVIAMYVGRIFDEVKGRPVTLVRAVYGRQSAGETQDNPRHPAG